jgi:GrpB-like predicted nucleotidyltransferase (UPF0157 family)
MRVTLADPDPRWPEVFARERERIRAVLGDRVLAIEHVGSTAVPELPAKPIVDVLVVLDDPDADLAVAGFERHGERFWKRIAPAVHVHTRASDSPDIARWIAFRDRLRSNEADRALYSATKRRLAEHEWARARDYADAKNAVIDGILRRA